MKKIYYVILLIVIFSFCSCLNSLFGEMKQVYPIKDLSGVKELEFYNYGIENSQIVTDSLRIKWYTDFFKDSTNYYRKESIDKEQGEKAIYGLKFISDRDTLDLTIYPAKKQSKIVVAFLDAYDPNEHWKYRRYNRFYINDRILDSLENNWN